MLHRRIYQFLIIYLLGIGLLMVVKYTLNLSDYVIPGPASIWSTGTSIFTSYLSDVMDTLSIAVVGQVVSICLALLVGVIGLLLVYTIGSGII